MVSAGVWWRACVAGLATALFLASSPASALPSTKVGTAPLISPTAADSFYGASTTTTNGTGASGHPKEVVELARALKNDPDLIYEYVRNNTTTTFTYGLSKGSLGVIIDRAGTSFDQAALMIDLLREAGYTASYKLGTITLTGAQFQAWTGITSAKAACQLLSSGAVPAIINGATTPDCSYTGTVATVELSHAWVAVTISGVTYLYDPAYKDHTFKTGVNLATATGISSGMAMGVSASSGAASGVNYAYSYGASTLNTNLATAASTLETYINTNVASGDIGDVVGGKVINPQAIPSGGLRQASLPYTTNVYRTITGDLPDQYRIKLRIQISKARPDTSTPTVIDKTVFADEVYGRRLTFEPNFDTSGASFSGALKLTDDLGTVLSLGSVAVGTTDNPSYSRGAITITADLPYAANSGGYMDTTITKAVSYALPLTIVTGFGDVGRGLVDKWGQRRDSAMPSAPDSTCKVCFVSYKAWKGDGRRETLAAAWLAQSSRAGQLNAAIGQGVFAQHYSIGVSAADTTVIQTPNGSWWVTDSYDRLDVETGFSLTSTSADATGRRAAVLAAASAMSTLKGSVSAQISDLPDVGTVATRLEWGNAPPSAEDIGGAGAARRVYEYSSASLATNQALNLAVADYATTTSNGDLQPDGQDPLIGNTETVARRTAAANAIVDYANAGFTVAASQETFLGPGKRAGGLAPSSGYYTHSQTPQRGGAFTAVKVDANGDPTEIADVLVNPIGYGDQGGGGAQTFHQAEYDPATSADVVKGRFVMQPTGTVIVGSPAKVTVGQGPFPYSLSASLTWRGGDVRDETYGPGAHREPQGGWTTNVSNTFTISGSGLEAMGETDPRAAIGTIAAFYAAQDAYKSSWSAKRELAAQLVQAWWLHSMSQNVATAAIGTETRQWIKKPNGTWLTPGAATYGSLTQTGSATNSPRHPSGYSNCTTNMVAYVPTRGWSYSGVSFTVTGAKSDQQAFSSWTNQTVDTSAVSCAEQRGFRLSTWTWPQGVQLTWAYARPAGYTTQIEALASVSNNVGASDGSSTKWIKFNGGGFTGFYATNSSAGASLMSMSASFSGAEYTHTDAVSAVTKFDIATLGAGDFAKLVMDRIYAADDAANPATQYVYDTVGRVAQVKDKLVLAGSRAPTQYFLANGLRSEILNALGYSSTVYADLMGRPTRTIDGAGAVSAVVYDGLGRPSATTSPDGDQVQLTYNTRNHPTQVTKLARAGSAEAGQTLSTQTGWSGDLPIWTKDARGNQTDFSYTYGELTRVQYPSTDGGVTRDEADQSYYSDGQAMALTTASGQNLSQTYTNGTSWASLTDTVGSTSGAYFATDYSTLGDPTTMVSPAGGLNTITYDALRRPTLILEPTTGVCYKVSYGSNGCTSTPSQWPLVDPNVPRRARRLTYDVLGRVTKVEIGTYLGTTFTPLQTYASAYDPVGNRIKQTGPAGVVQMSYDALNRPTCTAIRMNAAVYDTLPADACQPSTPGSFGPDRISRATYDAAGRVVQTEAGVGTPLQQVTETDTFSPGGQRLSLTDANGNTSGFAYDGFGRLKRLYYPAAPRGSRTASTTDYEEYGYDANGNRTSFRKRDGTTIAYQYDARNRLTVKDFPGTTADDVYFTYLSHGAEVQGRLGSPTASVVYRMAFDQANRLSWEGTNNDGIYSGYSVTYDSEGRRSSAYFGHSYVTYAYDMAGRLASITAPNLGSQPFETVAYDALGRRSSITRANGVVTSYSYDAAGRLVGLAHGAPKVSDGFYQTLGFNPAGQLVSNDQKSDQYVWSGHPTTTTNFAHDQLNRDAAVAAAAGYDANGNLISDGTRTFTYDAENRLRSVTSGSAAVTLNYDPFGRLMTYTVGSTTTNFRYAGAMLSSEFDSGGNQLRSYVSDPGTGELMLWLEGPYNLPQANYLEQDRLGTVVSTSDVWGVVTPYTYGPYGEPQTWSGSRFRYTGQIALPEAQLYHYRARAYDPVMGRFLQTDPTGYGDGPNIYAYVHGDPVNGTDPSGTMGADITDLQELVVTASRGFDAVVFTGIAIQNHFSLNPTLNIGNLNVDLGNLAKDVRAATKDFQCFMDPDSCASDLPGPLRPGPNQRYIKGVYDALRNLNVQQQALAALNQTDKSGNENSFWAVPQKDGSYAIQRRPESGPLEPNVGQIPTSQYGDVIFFHTHTPGNDQFPSTNDTSPNGVLRNNIDVVISQVGTFVVLPTGH